MKSINIGICGLGTIGAGTFNLIDQNSTIITQRTGREIRVIQVSDLIDNPACDLSSVDLSRDIFEVARNPQVDILVELIGGTTTALKLILSAIENNKHVVTANKALIAQHGREIFAAAEQKGVMVAYEASIGGGIPIVKALREGLAANRVQWIAGIINGTSNYILTEMEEKQRDFADVLSEAQQLGYAEADPTFDIEGIDAAHKLTILSSIAFGHPLQFDQAYTEGIAEITQTDIRFASELGYRIKHLGITRRLEEGVELRVHPALIAKKDLLANISGVMNAVMVNSDAAGSTMYYGAGAGAVPTASAVVADIIDMTRSLDLPSAERIPYMSFQPEHIQEEKILPVSEIHSAYYLRMDVLDKPGEMANISRILSEDQISIEALIQKEAHTSGQEAPVPIVIITDRVKESLMDHAIAAIEEIPDLRGRVTRIRVESLAGE
ncbi:MAG: homoserine dehydrogenase [Pseudomonadales bacterium]|nr:homoserine dehydrogenase [Pseudomonadales bacterium]MDP7145885.1 homoserine dehydrogenase [Pseudomonadales bacterium]MDP7597412.1 homoserine dehydrogenase [Pseudomonadales bacterium]HJN50112.1 homoserine dehydrogenase [Pseudomonadales bacterium]